MEDPKLILELQAITKQAAEAFSHDFNMERHWSPDVSDRIITEYDTRGVTPPARAEDPAQVTEAFGPRIRVDFDQEPKDIRQGYLFGRNAEVCDVFLGGMSDGISRKHFSIAFDAQGRLVLKSESEAPTRVSYNGKSGLPRRKHFTWVLLPGYRIKVGIGHESIFLFEVRLGNHDSCQAEYQALVRSYLDEYQSAIVPLNSLDTGNEESTTVLTQSNSLLQESIYHQRRELGSGAFGTVHECIDVSTGHVYAAKVFYRSQWQKEVGVLRQVSHVRILPLEESTPSDQV